MKPAKRGRLRHIDSQGGISRSETDSDNFTDVCKHPDASKISEAFAILEEEHGWHKRTKEQMLRARRNFDRETRRVAHLEKKLDEQEAQLEAKDKEIEQLRKEFAELVSFMDKYRAKSVAN